MSPENLSKSVKTLFERYLIQKRYTFKNFIKFHTFANSKNAFFYVLPYVFHLNTESEYGNKPGFFWGGGGGTPFTKLYEIFNKIHY